MKFVRTDALAALTALATAMTVGCTSPQPLVATPATGNESIEVTFTGIEPNAPGALNVALWSSADSFMKDKQWFRAISIPARNAGQGVAFEHLPLGIYAVSAFHDRTDSGTFRRGLFGMPLDPWAVSNGSSPLIPPAWPRAKFEALPGVNHITLAFYKPEAPK